MKKGISLIMLVLTVIILTILAGVIIINSTGTIISADKSKLHADISQLEVLMNIYKTRKNGTINFEIVQFDTTQLSTNELKQFEGENIVDNRVYLYVIELYEIDAEETNYGNTKLGSDDRYLYSNITGKVYYERGLVADDITYYYIENGEGII